MSVTVTFKLWYKALSVLRGRASIVSAWTVLGQVRGPTVTLCWPGAQILECHSPGTVALLPGKGPSWRLLPSSWSTENSGASP